MSDTTDERPSIAELQRAAATGYGWPNDNAIALNHATPVLLEIAAAALAWLESDDEDRAHELARLEMALSKARP